MLGKNLNLLRSTFYTIGQIFMAANSLILRNNLAIWSHCMECQKRTKFAEANNRKTAKRFGRKFFLQMVIEQSL